VITKVTRESLKTSLPLMAFKLLRLLMLRLPLMESELLISRTLVVFKFSVLLLSRICGTLFMDRREMNPPVARVITARLQLDIMCPEGQAARIRTGTRRGL
jgi:hypothetical protein